MSMIKTGSRSPLLPDVVNTKSRAKKKRPRPVVDANGKPIENRARVKLVVLKGRAKFGTVVKIDEARKVHVKIDGLKAVRECNGTGLEVVADAAPASKKKLVTLRLVNGLKNHTLLIEDGITAQELELTASDVLQLIRGSEMMVPRDVTSLT